MNETENKVMNIL